MLTFIKKIYKNRKKDYHLLLIMLTILSSFEFSFLAMYDAFTKYSIPWNERTSIFGVPFLGSVVAVVLSIFITKYFIANKKQEFSILLLSGRKPKDLFVYLIIQFGILTFLAFLIGLLGGTGIMYIVNLISQQSSQTQLIFTFTDVLLYNLCYLMIMIFVILAISARQFVQLDSDIAKYITHKAAPENPAYQIKMSSVKEKKKIPFFSIISSCIILYLTVTSLIQLLNPNQSFIDLLIAFTFALAGEIFIVNMTIPLLYDFLHNHFLLKHPILMNALSSFNEFSRVMATLINLNACIIPIMLFLLLSSSSSQLIEAMILPAFIMVIIMISLCFILRFVIYIQDQKPSIATLHAIGYGPKALNSISVIKNLLFTFLIIVIPFLFLGELFYKAYIESLLSYQIILGSSLTYLIVYIGIIIYIFIKEKTTQKEVMNNVKYLNRGQ